MYDKLKRIEYTANNFSNTLNIQKSLNNLQITIQLVKNGLLK